MVVGIASDKQAGSLRLTEKAAAQEPVKKEIKECKLISVC
jgi:hypothetical protein